MTAHESPLVARTAGIGSGQDAIDIAARLTARHCPYAALEAQEFIATSDTNDAVKARAHFFLGLTRLSVAHMHEALESFVHATQLAPPGAALVRYRMHEAVTHDLLGQHDRAQRLLTHLLANTDQLPDRLLMQMHANLAFAQAHSEFYQQALSNTQQALQYVSLSDNSRFPSTLYSNLGFLLIELQDHESAEKSLIRAMNLHEPPALATLTELGRLYLAQNRYKESVTFANQAISMVWSTILNYQREEIARLCSLLAHLAFHLGEQQIALRLLEKSQLLFGQLSMWSQWQQTQSLMDTWRIGTGRGVGSESLLKIDFHGIRTFLFLFDAMNAQELTYREFPRLTDARVQTVQALCDAMQISESETNDLIYAARFADYGLTALEPDVVQNPRRSEYAWQQYCQHPELSIRMLQVASAPERVLSMIRDHHEHWDGSGFPAGKSGTDITPLAQVLTAADVYATDIVRSGKTHSQALQTVRDAAGTILSGTTVASFEKLFTEIS